MVTSLELADLCVSYGRRRVLHHITTPPMRGGEVVALIGPNAAGKSTLLRRIAGLLGGEGQVTLENGTDQQPRACYLPQDTAANAVLTVYESVLIAVKRDNRWRVDDEALARIDALLKLLAIEHLAFRNLSELSGGQRQLVSVAQTLGRDPDVMLLDEPTSALDLRHQYEVATLIRRITRERGLVSLVSIHDLNLALRLADRVLVLAEGHMVAFGEPKDVVTPHLLSEVYGVRARVEGFDVGEPQIVILAEASELARANKQHSSAH